MDQVRRTVYEERKRKGLSSNQISEPISKKEVDVGIDSGNVEREVAEEGGGSEDGDTIVVAGSYPVKREEPKRSPVVEIKREARVPDEVEEVDVGRGRAPVPVKVEESRKRTSSPIERLRPVKRERIDGSIAVRDRELIEAFARIERYLANLRRKVVASATFERYLASATISDSEQEDDSALLPSPRTPRGEIDLAGLLGSGESRRFERAEDSKRGETVRTRVWGGEVESDSEPVRGISHFSRFKKPVRKLR